MKDADVAKKGDWKEPRAPFPGTVFAATPVVCPAAEVATLTREVTVVEPRIMELALLSASEAMLTTADVAAVAALTAAEVTSLAMLFASVATTVAALPIADVALVAKLAASDVISEPTLAATDVAAVARLTAPEVISVPRLAATEVTSPATEAIPEVTSPKTLLRSMGAGAAATKGIERIRAETNNAARVISIE